MERPVWSQLIMRLPGISLNNTFAATSARKISFDSSNRASEILPDVEHFLLTNPILLSSDLAQLFVILICPPCEDNLETSRWEIIPSAAPITTSLFTTPFAAQRLFTNSCTASSSSSPRSSGLPLSLVSRLVMTIGSLGAVSSSLLLGQSFSFKISFLSIWRYSVFSLLAVDSLMCMPQTAV